MSTTTTPRRTLRRTLAGVMTTTLAASGIALLPAGAQAAETAPAPTLTWKISQQFVDHLSTRTLSGGATYADGTGFTFGGGVGYTDSGNGVSRIAYQGSVKGAFVNQGTEFYSVTVADPIVSVDADGEGTVSAVVSSQNAASPQAAAASSGPARVVVTTFDATAADWTSTGRTRSLTDTPAWAGVLPADSPAAAELGIGTGKPVDGKAFAPSFLGGVVPGVRAHFYASGAGSDVKKNPATFVATVGAPSVTASTTSATPAGGLNLSVAGTGFTQVTNPGDAGVYVGLAPSGGLPDTSSFDTSAFAAAAWVSSIDQVTGSFTTTLNAPTAKLDPSTTYSLYTWRAHAHSTPSQDTETPVAIAFADLEQVTSAPSASSEVTAYGSDRTLKVTVPRVGSTAPTGTVTLSGAVSQSAPLVGGTATFQLPRTLRAGASALTVAYSGDGNYRASTSTHTLSVAKATVSVKRNKIAKKPTSRRSGKTSVSVGSTAGKVASGKVTVTFKKKGQKTRTKKVTVKNGKASVTIPKLAKGTWKVTVKYTGSDNYAASATRSAGSVKVKK